MAFFAWQFYLERTVFVDISFHLFYLLKTGYFAIQNNRIGAFFTQLFPLAGRSLGLSLAGIARLYSLSFVVLPFITFLVLYVGFRREKLAMGYLLFTTLITTHTFFWIQSELPQGMAFYFIFLGLLDLMLTKEKRPLFALAAMVLLLFFVSFSHPLLIFPFVFAILFYGRLYPLQWNLLGAISLVYLGFYLIKVFLFRNPYDSQAMVGLSNIGRHLVDFFQLPSNRNFIDYTLRDYFFLPVLLLINVWFFVVRKQWFLLLLSIGFFVGYVFMVNISYPQGGHQFYLENQYLILGFFVAWPFATQVLPTWRLGRWEFVVPLFIGLVFLLRVYGTHGRYAQRLSWNRDLLKKTEALANKKLVVSADDSVKDILFQTWGSAYEFWLLSTIEGGESRSVVMEQQAGEYDWTLYRTDVLITNWGCINYTELPSMYFRFSDSSAYTKYSLH